MRALSITVAASLAVGGCAAVSVAPPITSALIAASGGKPAVTLAMGREIFAGRCTACHSADPVGKYSIAKWREIVGDMAHRAKLDATQQAALLAYLAAAHDTTRSTGN